MRGYAPKEVPLGDAPKEVPLGDAPKEVPLGDAPKVSIPLDGKVPFGDLPSCSPNSARNGRIIFTESQ
jgi:hypothetical protein